MKNRENKNCRVSFLGWKTNLKHVSSSSRSSSRSSRRSRLKACWHKQKILINILFYHLKFWKMLILSTYEEVYEEMAYPVK